MTEFISYLPAVFLFAGFLYLLFILGPIFARIRFPRRLLTPAIIFYGLSLLISAVRYRDISFWPGNNLLVVVLSAFFLLDALAYTFAISRINPYKNESPKRIVYDAPFATDFDNFDEQDIETIKEIMNNYKRNQADIPKAVREAMDLEVKMMFITNGQYRPNPENNVRCFDYKSGPFPMEIMNIAYEFLFKDAGYSMEEMERITYNLVSFIDTWQIPLDNVRAMCATQSDKLMKILEQKTS